MNDFLEVYDYYEPDAQKDCENIIKYFEHMYDPSRSKTGGLAFFNNCLLYTSPSPRDS